MKLYVDESGNTGETSSNDLKFNFYEQPYYVLAGILVDDELTEKLEKMVRNLCATYRLQGTELKAKNLYESKPRLIIDLIEYLVVNRVPIFMELMDKLYYLHIMIVDHFLIPVNSFPMNEDLILIRRIVASELGGFLNLKIYHGFIKTVKLYSNESLEDFYRVLIKHFEEIDAFMHKSFVEQTQAAYFERKFVDENQALKDFSPLPDENQKQRLIHLLPNYNAFSNMIFRTQFYVNEFANGKFDIAHDIQEQFSFIYQSALTKMKTFDFASLSENFAIGKKITRNIDENIELKFIDSKDSIYIQLADILSGVVMRFWKDFTERNEGKIKNYMPAIAKLCSPVVGPSNGINFVVPEFDYYKFMKRLNGI